MHKYTCMHCCTRVRIYMCVHAHTCSAGVYVCTHAYIHMYTHCQSPGAASKSSRATPPHDSGQHVSPHGTQTTFPIWGLPSQPRTIPANKVQREGAWKPSVPTPSPPLTVRAETPWPIREAQNKQKEKGKGRMRERKQKTEKEKHREVNK